MSRAPGFDRWGFSAMIGSSALPAMRIPGTVLSQVLAVALTLVLWMAAAGDLAARPSVAAIAVDASSGAIVYQKNIDSTAYPASLTKVMTLYLLFEDMRAGKISLSSRFTISAHAAAQQPTKLGLKPGATISVRDAIGAVVTRSANDIAVAIAEGLEGSEPAFAARMTRTARAMGMTSTTFHNASGLPDRRQKTTARDMATLGLRIQRDFPKQFHFFSTRTFHYAGRKIGNHNRLLGHVDGVDGIKTGYTRMSGFNLITSIERGGKRMVAVVMGASSGRWRNAYMTRLVNRLYKTARLKPLRRVAALAGHPPGYIAPPVHQALKVDTPPLPRPKPDLNADKPVVVAAKAASKPVAKVESVQSALKILQVAPPTEQVAKTGKQATTFKTVVVETLDNTDKARVPTSTTGKIGDAAQLVAEKALLAQPVTEDAPKQAISWNIQVGAFPTPEGAKRRIDTALSTGIKALDAKSAFTMKADVGGDTVYRARFSGFDEKAARSACRLLKRKGLGCFPLAPAAIARAG